MFGVQQRIRGDVWKLCLGIDRENGSKDETLKLVYKKLAKSIVDLDPVTCGKIRQSLAKGRLNTHRDFCFELFCFESHQQSPGTSMEFLVEISRLVKDAMDGNSLYESRSEWVLYWSAKWCLQLTLINTKRAGGIASLMKLFQILFRTCLPELFDHFEEKELYCNEWVLRWLESYYCGVLTAKNLKRLWDTFICSGFGLNLNVFVAVSLLQNNQSTLRELDYSALKRYLRKLPDQNMDLVITFAYNIRDEYMPKITGK